MACAVIPPYLSRLGPRLIQGPNDVGLEPDVDREEVVDAWTVVAELAVERLEGAGEVAGQLPGTIGVLPQ